MTVQSAAAPPAPVRTSFLLWVVNAGLAVVSMVLLLLGGPELMMAGQPTQMDPGFQQAAMIGLYVAVGFLLVVIALELFFAFQMRAGRNWARIVLAVLGGLAILLGLLGIGSTFAMLGAGPLGAANAVISLIGYPLTIAAIVFMFLPGARDWFAPRAARVPPIPAG
jgi:small-conductance mechanosensitive channel